jgi:hydrogenase nickel incorporation protein HypA/HybF
MHEIDLATSLVRLAEEAANRACARRVTTVHLAVGRLAGVEAGALRSSYHEATKGTLLEGSKLAIRDVPIVVWCAHCLREVELEDVRAFRCPACGTAAGEIRRGKELEIESLEIESLEIETLEKV